MRGRVAALFCTALVFAGALAVRCFFVFELRNGSYLGNVRVSDSVAYFELAQQIVAGTAPFEPYWQAPLYPLLLAIFQFLFGDSLHAVQWFHILIGSLNCALVFRLADALFGLRTAGVAAAIAIFYAPFWLFDAQPLPANLTMSLYLLMVLSYLRYRSRGGVAWLAGAGLLLGASILSHGLAIFTIPVFLCDLAARHKPDGAPVSKRRVHLALFLAAAVLAPGAVSIRNSIAAGTPTFVAYNAGINFYIGNHRDLEQTLARRAGYEWEGLFHESKRLGVTTSAALNEYFVGRAIEEWAQAPAALLGTSAKKLLLTLSGSEPKRNFPIYDLRESSWALSALLWELEVCGIVLFAFPGGLVLPLACLGFVLLRRGSIESHLPVGPASFPGWVAMLHMLGMVVFFPTARYRVPASTLLIPYAAATAVLLWDRFRSRGEPGGRPGTRAGVGAIAAVLLFVLVNPVASNVFRHPEGDRAEHLYYGARWAAQRLGFVDSPPLEAQLAEQANEAMRIDPTYPEPVELLAMYYSVSDPARARVLLSTFSELAPDNEKALKRLRDVVEAGGSRP